MLFPQVNSPLFASAVYPFGIAYARAMKTMTFEFQKTSENTFFLEFDVFFSASQHQFKLMQSFKPRLEPDCKMNDSEVQQ